MAEQQATETVQRKERSPNFPFISLEKAIERAQAFYEVERRNAVPVQVAVKRWSYAEKSSGGVQTIAALKSYGLMEDVGRGSERKIKLTESALQVLIPKPDSFERYDAIRTAALSPARMAEVYRDFPDHAPSDDTLRWKLVKEKKFSEESAIEFVKIWNKNKEFSRLYNSDTIRSDNEPKDEPNSIMETNTSAQSSLRVGQTRAAFIQSEKVIGPEGDILLQFSGDPSIETYEFLKDYIDLRLKTLARKREKGEA